MDVVVSESTAGVTDTEIRVGTSLALTGHAGYLGRETLRGAQCYINYINDKGGIHGRKIRLVVMDDRYHPPLCLANTQQLIVEEEVFTLFSYVGTPTTVRIIPLLSSGGIPLVGAFTGASALREEFNPYIINVRASYYQETGAAVEHFINDLGITKIAVFYQYDAYGFDGLRGAELALKPHGLTTVAKGTYIRGTTRVQDGLDKILASDAEAVIMIGTYDSCAEFIRQAKAKGRDMVYYTVSFVGAEELARRLGPDGDGVLVSQVVPPPELAQAQQMLKGVSEYLELLKRYYPAQSPSSVGLEGFFNAKVLVEGLTNAGPFLTRRSFIEAVEDLDAIDLGRNHTMSFSATDHQGMDEVFFVRIQDGRLELVTDWKELAAKYKDRS